MICMPLTFLLSVALLTLLTQNELQAQAFDWKVSPEAEWALGCNFAGNDIGNVRIPGGQCAGACDRDSHCSHFAWTQSQGGTCWFKGGRNVAKSSAIASSQPGAVCGILKSLIAANGQDSAGMTPSDILENARKYVPIFRFDDDAGGWCFPDDKEHHPSRNNICNGFSRHAPVYIHTKICGEYTVYQYNLWYGFQKGCVNQVFGGGRHDNDNEYVQVWTRGPTGPVAWVRYSQHNGYYFREAGKGAEIHGSRAVAYIGKIAHGAYHRGCTGGSFWNALKPNSGTDFCAGGCGYWDDFRNSEDSNYVLDDASLRRDPTPREIDCDPGMCSPEHNSWRSPKSAACFGVNH